MYCEDCDIVNYNRPLIVVVIDSTKQTKHYQSASQNDIIGRHIEVETFRQREISHTDWVQ